MAAMTVVERDAVNVNCESELHSISLSACSYATNVATCAATNYSQVPSTFNFFYLSFCNFKRKIKEIVFALLLEEVIPFLDGSADPVTVS